MKRAILYARVSTLDKQKPEAQIEQLRLVAAQRGWEVVHFCIDMISGATAERPSMGIALKMIRNGEADLLAAVAIDRVGRSVRHLVELHAELERLGCELVILRENVDTSTPTGRFVFQVMAAAAELERALIRERVTAGVRRAQARGVKLGRVATFDRALIPEAARLRRAGHSWGMIATYLGVGRGAISTACLKTFPDLKTQAQVGGRRGGRGRGASGLK